MRASDLEPYMIAMPDGSMVVATVDQIRELKALPEDQRLKRLEEMEAARDEGGPHEYAT